MKLLPRLDTDWLSSICIDMDQRATICQSALLLPVIFRIVSSPSDHLLKSLDLLSCPVTWAVGQWTVGQWREQKPTGFWGLYIVSVLDLCVFGGGTFFKVFRDKILLYSQG